MNTLEERIKEFARKQGIECLGIAGPDRLKPVPESPPSLDPGFIMKGARSAIVFALPMNVPAIYDFLSKKSATPHNIDQKRMVQVVFWKATRIQEFLEKEGFKAHVVRTNSDYRRSPNPFATHPSFSHRFGAIAAGIAAHGWSGNVMTREYGAAIYMSSVVTDAELKSDQPLDPRYFIDGYCSKCKLCVKTCAVQMFQEHEEEFVLVNGDRHPRAKRYNINLCNTSCFGLHGVTWDKKSSSWGRYWIKDWVGKTFKSTKKVKVFKDMLQQGFLTGTSFRRYEVIRRMASIRWPEEYYQSLPDTHNLPDSEEEQVRIQREYSAEKLGVRGLDDYNVSTCAHCALICGPTLKETSRRYKMLAKGGIVVPGPDGVMKRVETFEEAEDLIENGSYKLGFIEKTLDGILLLFQFPWFYFGFNPKSIWQGFRYRRALKKSRQEVNLPIDILN